MKRILLAISASFAASTAMAADVVYTEPAMIAPASVISSVDWTGFYVGAQGGYGFGSTGTLVIDPFTPALQGAFPAGDFFGDFNNGFVGGLHVGYDMQFGRFVVGGVFDVNYADLSDVQGAVSGTPATYQITREIDYLINARVRGGYLVTDHVLAYATAGLAYADVEFGYSQVGSAAAFTTSGGQNRNIGYTVGGGVEAMMTSNVSLGLEYLYTNLGGNDFEATLTGGPGGIFDPGTTLTGSDRSFDFHTVQLRLSYRF